MKYSITSIDNSRIGYKTAIQLWLEGRWTEVHPYCVDGRDEEDLDYAIDHFGYSINATMRVGQLGVWYSVLHALEQAPLVTFEDDAVLGPMFVWNFEKRIAELPDDADFFSLFLPRDSDHLYTPDLDVSEHLCKTYAPYGGVSMYFTEKGKESIKTLLAKDGIWGQYDDMLYQYVDEGKLSGYCSKPSLPDLVYITGQERSIVQESEWFK